MRLEYGYVNTGYASNTPTTTELKKTRHFIQDLRASLEETGHLKQQSAHLDVRYWMNYIN